jgi:hypothetical protein
MASTDAAFVGPRGRDYRGRGAEQISPLSLSMAD